MKRDYFIIIIILIINANILKKGNKKSYIMTKEMSTCYSIVNIIICILIIISRIS